MKNLTIGFVIGGGVGLVVGTHLTAVVVRRKLEKAEPLLRNAILNLINKIAEGDMSHEEIKRLAKEEGDFIRTALKMRIK